MNPECVAKKHNNCDGRAIDMDLDEFVNCICPCHNVDTAPIRREFTRE